MSNHPDLLFGPVPGDPFEFAVRGYSRSQVDEFIIQARHRVSDLEDRLSRALDETERLRAELAAALQQRAARPAHVELTERLTQILAIADEEAQEQRTRTADEIASMRTQAQQEANQLRDDARSKVDQVLASAREQADRAVTSARVQAESTTRNALAEAERSAAEMRRHAETALTEATAQARRVIEEATARAEAVNENTESRLSELTSRHAEMVQRLTEIRDMATGMVSRDTARGTLSDEVNSIVVAALAASGGRKAIAAGDRPEAAEGPPVPQEQPSGSPEPAGRPNGKAR